MKLNACMKLARRRSVHDALIQCSLTPRKGAMMLKTLLQSARANAIHNFSMDPARLIVDEVFVTKVGSRAAIPFLRSPEMICCFRVHTRRE